MTLGFQHNISTPSASSPKRRAVADAGQPVADEIRVRHQGREAALFPLIGPGLLLQEDLANRPDMEPQRSGDRLLRFLKARPAVDFMLDVARAREQGYDLG